jgi:hypothetical protein
MRIPRGQKRNQSTLDIALRLPRHLGFTIDHQQLVDLKNEREIKSRGERGIRCTYNDIDSTLIIIPRFRAADINGDELLRLIAFLDLDRAVDRGVG